MTKGAPFEIPTQTHFVEKGEGSPIILVHGLAASLHDWDSLLPELERAGWRSYALDLLGHGESPKPDSRSYKAKWVYRHLESWIESLQLSEPPVIVGHSLGGYLSLRYAIRNPQRVRALILTDPFYRLDQLHWRGLGDPRPDGASGRADRPDFSAAAPAPAGGVVREAGRMPKRSGLSGGNPGSVGSTGLQEASTGARLTYRRQLEAVRVSGPSRWLQ